jgi:hypothetical protein
MSLGLTLLGCTTLDGDPSFRSPITPSDPGSATFVRTCDTSVGSTFRRAWLHDSIVLGPIAFVGARNMSPLARLFADLREGKGVGFKILVVVRDGEPVTIRLAGDTSGVRLLYDPASFNAKRLSEGDDAVTFMPCGGPQQHTQFNGAILANAPGCVDVTVETTDAELGTVSLPLGASCPRS